MLWLLNSLLLVTVFPLALVCLLWGCVIQGDYQITLPNGYVLARANSYDIAIYGPEDISRVGVIPPLIVAIGVNGDLVFGKVEDSHNPWLLENEQLARDEKAEQEKARGYFLLNTKTHEVHLGLTKKAWMAALRDNGIHSEPQMAKPSWWLWFKYWLGPVRTKEAAADREVHRRTSSHVSRSTAVVIGSPL